MGQRNSVRLNVPHRPRVLIGEGANQTVVVRRQNIRQTAGEQCSGSRAWISVMFLLYGKVILPDIIKSGGVQVNRTAAVLRWDPMMVAFLPATVGIE